MHLEQGLVKGLEDIKIRGQVEIIQTYIIIKIGQNTEKSPRLEETCCRSNSSEKPSANVGVKSSQRSK